MFLKHSFAFLKHGSLLTYRAATFSVLASGLIFFSLVLGLRYYLLPHIDEYREPIARAISASVGQRVTIGSLSGSWQGYRPEMSLFDVKVFGADGRVALAFERVTTVLSWLSLISAELEFDSLAVYGPSLEVKRDVAGGIWIAGVAIKPQDNSGDGFGRWLLAQRQVLVRDAAIVWLDEMRGAPKLSLDKVDFRLDRDGSMHRFGVSATPPSDVASPLLARGQFSGSEIRDLPSWKVKIYAEISYADLAAAQAWIPVPLELSSGVGSLRVWWELSGANSGVATADVRLANVRTRLAKDRPELVLSEVQGRLGWMQKGDRNEFSATSLGIIMAGGPALAPMQANYAYTAPAGLLRHSDVHVSNLDLAHLASLAEFLPIDDALRARLVRIAPAGTVEDAALSWEGEWNTGRPYTARATFNSLSARPDGPFPGLQGLNGQLVADERGGTASVTVSKGGFVLPNVFAEPIAIDFLTANTAWVVKPDAIQFEFKNASFTNEDLAGTVSGSYAHRADGRSSIDLNGALLRGEVRRVWRYVPTFLAGPQAWLKRALLAGDARETRFRVKGALKDFPFKDDKKGVFEVRTKASGVTIDFADGWPPITGVSGDVVFHGARMDIKASGAVLGLQLSEVQASHAELGKRDERLLIKGAVRGFSSDFLHFVATSPVAGYVNHATDDMKAVGVARLDLELGVALADVKASTVRGNLIVEDNEVSVPRLPPLARAGAHIAFTKNDFKLSDGHALLFGLPVSFNLSSQPDGSITSSIAGTLDMSRARALWKHPALALIDGQSNWRGAITIRNKTVVARVDSNLVGLASSLPPPFAKKAAMNLPLHLELREQTAGRRRVLEVNLDKVASAALLLDESEPGGVSRGMFSIGAVASLPASDGIWIKGKLESADTDSWLGLLSGGSGTSTTPQLAGVDLEIGALDINRRRFHDVRIYATPVDEQWQIKLGGREVVGDVYWTSGGAGKLIARLSKLTLPAVASVIEPARRAG
ncbi:MAG: YhdP family protein, partial [Burkholderiales bacterium]